ncbi:MAG TPA: sugar phosphate isomerase/epimerase, partial [Armatimonadota bacterium]|nr:sugar phosphate isomerase/epimerase [Armatimonadota bacterium]
MKISFMTFMTPEWTLDEVIAGARRHGYDGVEPRVTANHKHGIEPDMPAEARKEARERFADAGIEIACIATSCTFAATDPAKRQANIDNLKRHIELAADLGAPGIRVFGG